MTAASLGLMLGLLMIVREVPLFAIDLLTKDRT